MIPSNYVVAGFESLSTLISNFMSNKRGSWNDNFSTTNINNFFRNTCYRFLHSFGQNFVKTKNYDKHIQNEVDLYQKCRNTGLFDGCEFISDSGGFQASIGALEENQTQRLIDLYYYFLREHHNVIDKAFILDLPPGPGCKIFNNFKQVYDRNLESYNIAKNLPKESRDKVIYVHHFRTPKLWEIYTRILREEDMFRYFNNFGTGGIVANLRSDVSIPVAVYVLPLVPLLNECKKHGRKSLEFHILGGANYRDILFYEFFKLHVKKVHDIDLDITYDSSGLFKGLMIGRVMTVLDKKDMIVKKLSARSSELDKRFDYSRRTIDVYQQIVDSLVERHNFKPINIDVNSIYDEKTGTFYDDVKIYLMLYMLDMYSMMQELIRDFVSEAYPYYEEGKLDEFINLVTMQIRNLNQGKITRKQTAKSNIMSKSLDILTNLDEDHCKQIVDKNLASDEFTNLMRGRILEI